MLRAAYGAQLKRFLGLLTLALPLAAQQAQVQPTSTNPYPYARVQGTSITAAYNSCASGGSCDITIQPSYTGTEGDEVWIPGGLYKWDRTYPSSTRMDDQRFGRRLGFYKDVGTVDSLDGAGENVVLLHFSDPTTGVAHQVGVNISFLSIASGEIAYSQETDILGQHITVVCATLSICQGEHLTLDATKGEGDTGAKYMETNCWGGAFNGDDEGCKGFSNTMSDGTATGILPMGQVTAVSSDQNSLTMSVASLDGYNRSWGEGRYAVKVMTGGEDAVLYSVHALSQVGPSMTGGPHGHGAYGTVSFDPSDTALPVSTAWGQATTYLTTPTTNDVATVVSATSTVDSGTFINGPVCWEGGRRTGQGTITNVSAVSNGQQTFNVSFYEDPDGGTNQGQFYPWFFQGGLCGTMARPGYFDGGIGHVNQALPFIGATDAHTGVHGIHYNAGVSTVPGFRPGAANSSAASASLYKFYSAARIVGLKDPNASAGFLGSYIALEPHAWTASVGDLIESPATYSMFMTGSSTQIIARLPGNLRGHDEFISGNGIDGTFSHYHFVANMPASNFPNGAGPYLFDMAGPYGGIAQFHNPLPGATMFSVGCATAGCASYTHLTSYGANNAVYDEYHNQAQNQFHYGFRNGEAINVMLGGGIQIDSATNGVDLVNAPLKRATYVQTIMAAPASASAACPPNAMWHDDNYIYVCNAAGTASKRAALSAF